MTGPFDGLPLAVDMDGTLLRGDVNVLAFRQLLRRRPWRAALLPLVLLVGGRPLLKRQLGRWAPLVATDLPWRGEFIAFLENEKARGRRLCLATASDIGIARKAAAHIGLFDDVLGTEGAANIKAANKRRALERLFPQGFVYAGDSRADLKVWSGAAGIILVGAKPDVAARARRLGPPVLAAFA